MSANKSGGSALGFWAGVVALLAGAIALEWARQRWPSFWGADLLGWAWRALALFALARTGAYLGGVIGSALAARRRLKPALTTDTGSLADAELREEVLGVESSVRAYLSESASSARGSGDASEARVRQTARTIIGMYRRRLLRNLVFATVALAASIAAVVAVLPADWFRTVVLVGIAGSFLLSAVVGRFSNLRPYVDAALEAKGTYDDIRG